MTAKLFRRISGAVLLSAALVLTSCVKIEEVEKIIDVEKEVPVEPLAWYSYDGQSYSIHTLVSQDNGEDDYTAFFIGREPNNPYTSYIVLYILNSNLGKTLDLSDYNVMNRLDYMIQFEDCKHLYSPAFAPEEGSLKVERLSSKDGSPAYSIDMEVRWADCKTLSFKYSGSFEKGKVE